MLRELANSLSEAKQKQNLASKYLNEPVMYGGEKMTRGEVIKDMQKSGFSQDLIDRYLQGLERGMRGRVSESKEEVEVTDDDKRKTVTYEIKIGGETVRSTGIDRKMDNEKLRSNWARQAKDKFGAKKELMKKDGVYYIPATA